MATLRTDRDGFTVHLSRWETAGALHRGFFLRWQQVVDIEPTANLWSALRGIRAPGTGLPRVIMLGTMRHIGVKDFAAIYRDQPGVTIALHSAEFARLLISASTEQVANLVHGFQAARPTDLRT